MPVNIKEYRIDVVSKSTQQHGEKNKQLHAEKWWSKDIQLFGNKLGLKQREAFYADLGTLLSAGLDIQRSLELINKNYKKKAVRAIVTSISESIIGGASLSEALRLSGHFSDYEIFSIQIGEESGQLLQVLNELSGFYGKSIKYRQQLVGALAYPGFVIGFAFLVVFFLLKYLVPLFSDVYKKFDGELPGITQKIIAISDWVGQYGVLVFIGLGLIIGFLYSQREKNSFRKLGAFIILKMPVFGSIIQKIYLSRFCQSMYLLLNAKVPLLKAVNLIRQMVSFYPIEKALEKTETDILKGELLNVSLSSSTFFPNQFIALIQVGEEASNLDEMFQKMAEQYSEKVERKTAVISSLLEPILIISLGVLVGIILVAMYMPLFQMSVGN